MSDLSEEVLTTGEAAAYLKTTQYTVWRWCKEGRLPAFQIGRHWRIRRIRLEELIMELEAENTASNAVSRARGKGKREKGGQGKRDKGIRK
jgi:excisionase family DNA binding protein